ncbi:MAG: tRNA lysidine(34) synthetase TilS [Clostridia bacterium]|nr:tRNA lysidine(34) synthetase TilS [Clostridia bacterium]
MQSGDKVAVGVSGGADSVCLLHLLVTYRDELGIEVIAAHLNHGLRGEDADRDEAFVRSFCDSLGVPLFVERADVAFLAKEKGLGVEECGREARYAFFRSLGADKIATAHHLNDAIETFLFRFARGTGLRGLCSIPVRRGDVIRPLINCTRDEIEEYCKAHNLSYVTDASNGDPSYSRNKIRMDVVPALKELNQSFESAAARCLTLLQADEDYLTQETERAYRLLFDEKTTCLELGPMKDLHPALRTRVLRRFCADCGIPEPEEKHILLVDSRLFEKGFALTFPSGTVLRTDGETLMRDDGEELPEKLRIPVSLTEDQRILFYEKIVSIACAENPGGNNAVDVDKIGRNPVVRSPEPGDAVTMQKRGCTKTLKKLYTELKIPARERVKLPVLADENGVIWAAFAGVDRSRTPEEHTKKIINIYSEDAKNEYGY